MEDELKDSYWSYTKFRANRYTVNDLIQTKQEIIEAYFNLRDAEDRNKITEEVIREISGILVIKNKTDIEEEEKRIREILSTIVI